MRNLKKRKVKIDWSPLWLSGLALLFTLGLLLIPVLITLSMGVFDPPELIKLGAIIWALMYIIVSINYLKIKYGLE